MNKTLQEGIALATELNAALAADKPNCEVIICTPFIHLASVTPIVDKGVIAVGAENCADKASGAYTGEVSAAMVASTGAQYVILGHSERRHIYKEDDAMINKKVRLALEEGLDVVLCIGELLEEREAGKAEAVCEEQTRKGLADVTAEQMKKVTIAYEPVWAIGTGKTATPEDAQAIHKFTRGILADMFGKEVAEATTIQYGGSMNAGNAAALLAQEDIDGGLIGGASLKVDTFEPICKTY